MIQRLQVKRNEKGFTLIELLIVIIVLGILAAIVVFAVGSTRKDSVASACKTDFKSMELSAEASNTNKGIYPAADTGLTQAGGVGGLLKQLPISTDYKLVYASATPFSTYSITVQTPAGVAVPTTPTAAAGCNFL